MDVFNLTTTERNDYEAGPYLVNFTQGDISAKFCINITDDEDWEMDETFILTINATNKHIILTKPYIVTVTIIDDECKYLGLTFCAVMLVIYVRM